LDFIEKVRARGETRLFPELKPSRDGTGQAASRWFARYRKKLGLYRQTPKKDFHSFRTTLINTLKQKGLPEPQVAALVGHSVSGITYERYGKAYNASMLLEVIRQADFSKSLEELKRPT
jgi:integrase